MSIKEQNKCFLWSNFLLEGSDRSFTDLYNYYVDKLYSYGLYLGFDPEMCKDAIQDVFLKIHSTRTKLTHINNPSSFLFRSFKNRLIDITKRSRNDINTDISELSFYIDTTVLDTIIDTERSNLLKSKVKAMLDKLSDTQREAIYLRYINEMDYREISEQLNIKEESARKLMHRAITALREQNLDGTSEATLILLLILLS